MSTHNICFRGEIRKLSILIEKKKQKNNNILSRAMLTIQNVPSEDCVQNWWMCRLIWTFAECTCLKVCFLTLWLIGRWQTWKFYFPFLDWSILKTCSALMPGCINPGPAEPRYALSLQTMKIQISWLLQKPTDLDLHCLPFSMWICIINLDQVIWLAKN